MFSALMELKGDKGARKFLEQHPKWWLPFLPRRKLDIDTETDYENLQLWKKKSGNMITDSFNRYIIIFGYPYR